MQPTVIRRLKDFARAWLSIGRAQRQFENNLKGWGMGGPGQRGWTRTGPAIPTPDCSLVWMRRRVLEIEDCFAKNRAETERWHLAFLKTYLGGGDLHSTAYWHEYLTPRFSRELSERKVAKFIALYESIASGGYRSASYPWIADLSTAGLDGYFGFRYFRFDGSHRLACLHTLGIRQAPCLVFSVRCKGPAPAQVRARTSNNLTPM